jgi:hypothetical protein
MQARPTFIVRHWPSIVRVYFAAGVIFTALAVRQAWLG